MKPAAVLPGILCVGSHVSAEWTWTATYSGPSPIGPLTNHRIFPAAPADTTRP